MDESYRCSGITEKLVLGGSQHFRCAKEATKFYVDDDKTMIIPSCDEHALDEENEVTLEEVRAFYVLHR